jgi:DNA-binding response OmpR family regulator
MPKKILIIDDDPDIVSYLDATFKDAGYATAVAYQGEEALQKVKTEKPDLITWTWKCPSEGPCSLWAARRGPVIVISGSGRDHNP